MKPLTLLLAARWAEVLLIHKFNPPAPSPQGDVETSRLFG